MSTQTNSSYIETPLGNFYFDNPQDFDYTKLKNLENTNFKNIYRFLGQDQSDRVSLYTHSRNVQAVFNILYPEHSDMSFVAFFHDISEYFISDIPTPLKNRIDQHSNNFLKNLEENILDCFFKQTGFSNWKDYWEEVQEADSIMLVLEGSLLDRDFAKNLLSRKHVSILAELALNGDHPVLESVPASIAYKYLKELDSLR